MAGLQKAVTPVMGRHRSSSERFDFKGYTSCDKQAPPPASGKQGDVLEWLQKVEFGPSGIWRAQEAIKISTVLSDAHKSIQDYNSNRAGQLQNRLQKTQERVEQLKSRMARAEQALSTLNQATPAAAPAPHN
jgi:hypothetical protein